MSASLVGSEMCIRDRIQEQPQSWCPKLPKGAVCTVLTTQIATPPAKWLICLLYTSDAADDM
eukprot:3320521-Alexandrium_andersonii.AAC.1